MLREININPFTRKTKKGVKSVRGYKRKIKKKDNSGRLAAGLGATGLGASTYAVVEGIPRILEVDQAKGEIPGLGFATGKSKGVIRSTQAGLVLGGSLLGAGLGYGAYKGTNKLLSLGNKKKDSKKDKRKKIISVAAGAVIPVAVAGGVGYALWRRSGFNPAKQAKTIEAMRKAKANGTYKTPKYLENLDEWDDELDLPVYKNGKKMTQAEIDLDERRYRAPSRQKLIERKAAVRKLSEANSKIAEEVQEQARKTGTYDDSLNAYYVAKEKNPHYLYVIDKNLEQTNKLLKKGSRDEAIVLRRKRAEVAKMLQDKYGIRSTRRNK